MAGGQILTLLVLLAAAFAGGATVQYVRDCVHCDRCHHIDSPPDRRMN